ncbi:protein kinase domain-containing protein [Sorangium sp. So ce1097]|uniref:serine/threonine-protein kinase n=1 Tax=Sorangium sp. So ce1097 TaxID=3133330 RepID=UPI003F6361C6
MPERPPEPPLTSDEAAKQRAAAYLGRVISKRYRIDEVIAMGGMGAVYRGEHVHMHKRVAIKILHPDTERLPELVHRFEREAIAGAHIQHRNVATATDFGEAEDGSFFLVLEYVRGTTLHEIIRRGPMPIARAVVIARQLAAALDATHAMHIVHRDLKPRNVMVVEPQGDLVKLIDFGLAKVSVDQLRRSVASPESVRAPESLPARLTTAGVIFGTIAYLAPESALGMDFVDERADLYALGLIFYEMLAGKHPFPSRDPVELFNQHRSAPVPAIAEHAPGVAVPPAIEAVVRRLLEKQPRARFETAAELIGALDQACAASGIAAQEPRAEMSSRAEMTSVPAIGEAPRAPSNRPPLPSAASREPEPSPGSASAVVLGDSCLVSLNEVADVLESAAQREAGGPAGGGAGAQEPERAGALGDGGAGAAAGAGAAEPAQDDAEEAPASFSRPTPVRNTPTLFAELTRDSRPTAVGGAAFMAQVAFSRGEAAGGDGPAGPTGADVDELTSDTRPTAVGGAAFMAQVAFAREEAASRGVGPDAADAPSAPREPSRPPEEPARSQEEPASKGAAPDAALQERTSKEAGAPAPGAAALTQEAAASTPEAAASTPEAATPTGPVRPLEEAASKETTSARLPLEEQAPSPEALERRLEERSSKQPSLPGLEQPSQAPVAAGPSSARASTASAAGPSSARASTASAAEPSSARASTASAAEPSSARASTASAAEPSTASAAEPSSARPTTASTAGPTSARSTMESAAGPESPRPPALAAAEPAPSKPPAAAEPAPSKPPAAAEPAPSKPPAAAEPAPSKPPAAAELAPSKPPAPSAAAPASQPPAPPEKAQPPQGEPPAAAEASPPRDEPPADDAGPASEPTSERLSGSRPAFAPTLLRELEAAEAERVAREREEEARRKRAEEEARAAREREEKARRKLAAREARAAQRSQGDPGARLRRIAPYLAGAVIAAGVIAALAGGGRAPPEPVPQLGQASLPASAPTTSEPVPPDPAAAAEPPGPTAAPPDAADAPPAAPETPAEPPPDEAGRKALADAARGRRWVKAAEALNALAERDPTALRDRAIAIAARNVAIAISKTGGELADEVFDALATRFGAEGLDVLYEIVETRGRSTPATRAAKLLRDPEVAARGTPAVRIAFELRDATCGEKLPFLDRAVTEGDKRTLVVLETAVRPCYTKNRAIDEAIKTLRARLEGG